MSAGQGTESDSTRGVTPVVGIILVVAVTVIVAGVAGMFVLTTTDLQEPAPQASFDIAVDYDEGEAVVTHQGGEAIDTDRLRVEGGTITQRPETVAVRSQLHVDLDEDPEQLAVVFEHDRGGTILAETPRDPFITAEVRVNPPMPGVLLEAEADGTVVAQDRTDDDGVVRLVVPDPDREYDITIVSTSGDDDLTVEDNPVDRVEIDFLNDTSAERDEISDYSTLDESDLDDPDEGEQSFEKNPFLEDAQTDNGGVFANLGDGEVVALEEGTKMSEFPTSDVDDYDGQVMQPVYASTVDDESIDIEVDSIGFGPTEQALGVDPYNEEEFGEDDQWYRIPTGIGTPYPIEDSETAWDENGNFEGEPISGGPDGDYKLDDISETDDGFKVVWEYLGDD